MAVDSTVPTQMIGAFALNLEKLVRTIEQNTVATLAAAIIVARGHPTSVQDVLEITRTVQMGMYPPPINSGSGQEWARTKDEQMAKIYT